MNKIKEKVFIVRFLNIIGNLAGHGYYIFEHIAWMADSKLIKVNSTIYWALCIISWLISLLTSIIV
jgi:hypothetical protein